MKVTVFGASGQTGKLVVERAIASGHTVIAFVHKEGGTIDRQNLRVLAGDVTDGEAVRAAVAGSDAIIDAIGGKTPYVVTTLESTAARNIIDAMRTEGVRRLVVISMVGIGDSVAQAPFWYEYLMMPTFLRGATKDKTAMEAEVNASGLDFVIARPPVLTDDAATGSTKVIEGDATAHKITRADLAQFLVEQLESDTYLRKAVTVVNS